VASASLEDEEADDDPERLPLEFELDAPLLAVGVPDDPVLAVPDAPDVACELVAPELVAPAVLAAPVVAALWAEPGSAAAMAPVASTLATPAPAVTTESRFMPRRRSAPGETGRPRGSMGISDSSPSRWAAAAASLASAVLHCV